MRRVTPASEGSIHLFLYKLRLIASLRRDVQRDKPPVFGPILPQLRQLHPLHVGLILLFEACLSENSKHLHCLSRLILLGILISYLPQHHRIISRRSSEGISPYFVLLGTTSGTCAFANILTLPASQRDLGCCKELSGFACTAGVLGIAQVGIQWMCFTVM